MIKIGIQKMETLVKNTGIQKREIEYSAFYIAGSIDLIEYKKNNHKHLISSNASELYYHISKDQYLLILNYGLMVFAGFSELEIKQYLDKMKSYCSNTTSELLSDELTIILSNDPRQFEMTFDFLTIGRFDLEINKAIMLNLAQSVGLNYYDILSQQILREIKNSTLILGKSGKIKLKHKEALRLSGQSLTAKNGIAENLYILDSPDITWEDEYIDKIHKTLSRHFELRGRYQSIENTFKIIEDNLNLYIAYNHHRESSRLEWIIIILIVIEVLDTLISKLI
ncbi:MAG: RMD1 family protein [Cytophagales bacterium]